MANQEHALTPHETAHIALKRAILQGLRDTPLMLKGGTGLLLAYGLDRFSEDLDFDAPHKLNLESRIRRHIPAGFTLTNLHTLKDSATVTRYRVQYLSTFNSKEAIPGSLKLEVSYQTPAPESEVCDVDGIRVASLARILDQKLKAAHDGDDPRDKVRDLYDLTYIARGFPGEFTSVLAVRLQAFSANPAALVARYRADFEEDDLVQGRVDLEELALSLHYLALAL